MCWSSDKRACSDLTRKESALLRSFPYACWEETPIPFWSSLTDSENSSAAEPYSDRRRCFLTHTIALPRRRRLVVLAIWYRFLGARYLPFRTALRIRIRCVLHRTTMRDHSVGRTSLERRFLDLMDTATGLAHDCDALHTSGYHATFRETAHI